jgi:hypothetical protein
MGDDYGYLVDKDKADETLDALEDTIRSCQPGRNGPGDHQGFHIADVILMIKLWEKAIIVRLGKDNKDWFYYTMNMEPPKLPDKRKRSDVLWEAIERYRQLHLENQDAFNQAQQAMRNFVWEYRRGLTDVNDSSEFVKEVHLLISAGKKGLAGEALLPSEQHA